MMSCVIRRSSQGLSFSSVAAPLQIFATIGSHSGILHCLRASLKESRADATPALLSP